MYKVFFILTALGGLLGGCSGSNPPTLPDYGSDRNIFKLRDEQLLADSDGWRVWEFTDVKIITCMAVKPVAGTDWPSFSDSTLAALENAGEKLIGRQDISVVGKTGTPILQIVPTSEGALRRQQLSGGAGFFMFILNNMETPYFGFYGKYPYRLPAVATLGGQTVADINRQDTVLSWEGKPVSFRVRTLPDETSQTIDEATGALDFTGVNKAYQRMMECHSRSR